MITVKVHFVSARAELNKSCILIGSRSAPNFLIWKTESLVSLVVLSIDDPYSYEFYLGSSGMYLLFICQQLLFTHMH